MRLFALPFYLRILRWVQNHNDQIFGISTLMTFPTRRQPLSTSKISFPNLISTMIGKTSKRSIRRRRKTKSSRQDTAEITIYWQTIQSSQRNDGTSLRSNNLSLKTDVEFYDEFQLWLIEQVKEKLKLYNKKIETYRLKALDVARTMASSYKKLEGSTLQFSIDPHANLNRK